jgi:threonine synthase
MRASGTSRERPQGDRRGRGNTALSEERQKAEQEFIASVFLAEDVRAFIRKKFPGLSSRRFRDERHRVLWRALEVLELGEGAENRTMEREQRLYEELEKAGALGRAGGRKYLKELLGTGGTPLMARVLAHTLGFTDPGNYYAD